MKKMSAVDSAIKRERSADQFRRLANSSNKNLKNFVKKVDQSKYFKQLQSMEDLHTHSAKKVPHKVHMELENQVVSPPKSTFRNQELPSRYRQLFKPKNVNSTNEELDTNKEMEALLTAKELNESILPKDLEKPAFSSTYDDSMPKHNFNLSQEDKTTLRQEPPQSETKKRRRKNDRIDTNRQGKADE